MNAQGLTRTNLTADYRLPTKHATDWWWRCGEDNKHRLSWLGSDIVDQTERTVTLRLTASALKDLIDDAEFYVECMGPNDTGDIDYRPAARRCLARLDRLGAR